MDANDKNFNQIEQFLDDELSSEEKTTFQQAIAKDPELEKEVRKHRLVREGVATMRREELRQNIRSWRKESRSARIRRRTFQLSIAAAAVVLIGAFFFLWPSGQTSAPLMAANYYEEDLSFWSNVKSVDEPEDPLQAGIDAYENQNYEESVRFFQQFPNENRALYALGQSYYKQQAFNQAAEAFGQAAAGRQYREKARWYQLLSAMQAGQSETELLPLMETIIAAGGTYGRKAAELKKRLKW